MAENDSNIIRPIQRLRNLTAARRRKKKSKRDDSGGSQGYESDQSDDSMLNDDTGERLASENDRHFIDYRA